MTIQCPAIEEPVRAYYVRVLRAPCYNVIFRPERWEVWRVLASTEAGAMRVARYHFYRSSRMEFCEAADFALPSSPQPP